MPAETLVLHVAVGILGRLFSDEDEQLLRLELLVLKIWDRLLLTDSLDRVPAGGS